VNVSVGTIFSVLRHDETELPGVADYLQRGEQQVAAGYAIYGPATMLVISAGKGTHGFTLDREIGNFILTHPNLQIPADTGEFAINTSNARFWEPPVHRYVTECQAGKSGIRGRDFNMRWIASLVAEVHRILMRGGVFMYPRDSKDKSKPGRLRLPVRSESDQSAGGAGGRRATTGNQRLMEVKPESLHQRVGLILGSRNEVERIERYHAEYEAAQTGRSAHRSSTNARCSGRRLGFECGPRGSVSSGEFCVSISHPIIAVTGSSGAEPPRS